MLARLRHRLLLRRLAGPRIVRAFADAYPEARFVEIGANDGEQHDHLAAAIRSRRWRGVMVEPVPYVFQRLRRNYAGLDRVALENAAIADRDGRMPFFHLAEAPPDERERLPDWYDAIGSFSREAVLGHGREIPDVERRLVSTEVPVLTFETLLRRHALDRVDLLLLDSEGSDWEILRAIDLAAHRPRLVVYEHYHLAPGDRAAAERRLAELGYETLAEGFDTFCLVPGDDALTRSWRRLAPAVPAVSALEDRAGG